MVQISVLTSAAEKAGTSDKFIKYLEAGNESDYSSLTYSKVVKSIKNENDSLDNYLQRSGHFMTALANEDKTLKEVYNLADNDNRKILKEAYPNKLPP